MITAGVFTVIGLSFMALQLWNKEAIIPAVWTEFAGDGVQSIVSAIVDNLRGKYHDAKLAKKMSEISPQDMEKYKLICDEVRKAEEDNKKRWQDQSKIRNAFEKIKDKIILLVGLMGSGKTSVGRRLAKRLNLPFVDGDQEIEKAAGLSLVDVLKCFGEEEYRAGEMRVMKRLLQGNPCVLASGGGSFVAEQTRRLAKDHAITIWLKADIDILYNRTAGRKHRPFLEGNDAHLKNKLEEYIKEEYPYYSEADIVVETREEAVDNTVGRVVQAIENFCK